MGKPGLSFTWKACRMMAGVGIQNPGVTPDSSYSPAVSLITSPIEPSLESFPLLSVPQCFEFETSAFPVQASAETHLSSLW